MGNFIEYERRGQTFINTPRGFMDELTYASYRHNRQTSPEIAPEGWRSIFGESVTQFEARYQAELNKLHDDDKRTFCS